MKSEWKQDDDKKMTVDVDPTTLSPTSTFKLKRKGDSNLKFARWPIFGGYGHGKSLYCGQAFAFLPHRSLDPKSQVTRFTVYKSTADKIAGSLDFETWVSSSPRQDAIKHLRVTPYENGILISNQNVEMMDIDRAFEITVNDNGEIRKLDPELKIKKKDAR